MICQYDPPIIDNTTGPKASLYIHWFIINLPTSRKFYDKLDGIYHRSIDMFLVCPYVPLGSPWYFPWQVSASYRPLSSVQARGQRVSMGTLGTQKNGGRNVKNDAENRWETREPKQDRPENLENLDLGILMDFVIAKNLNMSPATSKSGQLGLAWPTHAI
jgi:hypothetical protein